MNTQPAMTPQEMHLHSLSVIAFAHAVHAASFHRVSDEHIVEHHKKRIIVMAEKLEAELSDSALTSPALAAWNSWCNAIAGGKLK